MSDAARETADRGLHRLTSMLYLLHLLGVMTVLTAVVGVGINHARRERVAGTMFASHFTWQIRTFWWMVGFALGGGALILLGELLANPLLAAIGALAILLALFWYVYRVLKGYMWLTAGEAVGTPRRDA
jgi:uncharacterized membrane protein